jgi:pSer/pThr/pTyr-binding forkhead associated (FHA) protein
MPLPARVDEGIVPTLVVYGGTAQGQLFSLSAGETIIGRSISATVPIVDDQASRNHVGSTCRARLRTVRRW